MNPLELIFALQRMQEKPRLVPPGMALPYQDITQGAPPPTPRFRDPEQMGPAPPSGGPLARMFKKGGNG